MDLGARKSHPDVLPGANPSASALCGVRALILVGGQSQMERFGEIPLALLDVLGRSVLMRTLDRIRAAGVGEICVITDTNLLPPPPGIADCKFGAVSPELFWEEALQRFCRLGRHSECVLLLRLGAWAEVDFAAMVNAYRSSGSELIRAYSSSGEALDIFVISSGSHSEAAALLRGELRDERGIAAPYKVFGYVNRLTAPASLRTLALDAFAGECGIQPCGREVRPGVWIGRNARVHRCARLVAPVFIGSCCNVRRDAVVTRGSSLEHHSEVDCATVIDNSSVMPYTRVGAGLDVEYSVVGFQQIHSTQRGITVEIEDPHLIGATTTRFSAPTFAFKDWLSSFLPYALRTLRSQPEGLFASAPKALGSSTPGLGEVSLAPVEPPTESYQPITTTRRYGNE